MKNKYTHIFLLVIFSFSIGFAQEVAPTSSIKPFSVDLDKYFGDWYDSASGTDTQNCVKNLLQKFLNSEMIQQQITLQASNLKVYGNKKTNTMYDKSSFGNSTYRFESMLTIDAKTLPVKGIITNRFYDKKQEGTNQVVRTCHFPYSEAMPIKYFFSDPYEIKIYEDSEPTMANSEIDPSKDKLILDATIHFHLHIE